jgi:molecular chaperone HtpG
MSAKKHVFKTEVKQLLHLMVHSLYSHKEIFLRELISNAADATDKLRFAALSDDKLLEGNSELQVKIDVDTKKNTISISDNGIGMNEQDVLDNLGTIASSGTSKFLEQLTGDQQKDSNLIGKFGVGFYSAFMVAEKVTVTTRKAGDAADKAVKWVSNGEGEFTLDTVTQEQRGTTVTLKLRKEETQFADQQQLKLLINKYSDHISVPVLMLEEVKDEVKDEVSEDKEGEDKDEKAEKQPVKKEYQAVNSATALWTRPRNEITEDEYSEFYKHVSHDYQNPLVHQHNKVEGKLDYTSLIYIPEHAPFDLYSRDTPRGLKLYVQRVFIMDNAEQFLPLYLRFVKGIVDTNDLSLNVSREILQNDPKVDSLKAALTKRVIDMLTKLAKTDGEKYSKFWNTFGAVIKEGPSEDPANKDKIAALLRFASTTNEDSAQTRSLADYIAAVGEKQEKVFYLTAQSYEIAKNSPYLEGLKSKNYEVLLLSDRIDEWLMNSLGSFDGKSLQDITKGDLQLDGKDKADKKDDKEQDKPSEEIASLIEQMKTQLGDKVQEVRVSSRLTDSPSCVVLNDHEMSGHMREMMKAAGQALPEIKPIFEINDKHPLIEKLNIEADVERTNCLIDTLFDQSCLLAGLELKQPSDYVARVNKLLLG